MEEINTSSGWVWVVVSVKGEAGHYLGLYDKKQDVNFIPAFPSRDAANDCFLGLPREKGEKYEVQAIHIEELSQDAKDNGFTVALVDGEGKILK